LLEKTLKSIEPFTSSNEKNSRFCVGCGEPATNLVKYDTEGAVIIEKYCDKCAKAIEDSWLINANIFSHKQHNRATNMLDRR
jgi:hypothetical protein